MVLYRLLQKLVNESESVQKECLQNGSLSMIEVHNPIIDFDTKQLFFILKVKSSQMQNKAFVFMIVVLMWIY